MALGTKPARLLAALLAMIIVACSTQTSAPAPRPSAPTRATLAKPPAVQPPVPRETVQATPKPKAPPLRAPPEPDPKDVARAKRLAEQGIRAYHQGEYDRAEALLKEGITLYPFMVEANLALGKIFLIRAAATRDPALMSNARLMFEMAQALDPQGREAALLLQLFAPNKD